MAGPFLNRIDCVCPNGGTFRTFAQLGSYGSICTSCGAQGPVTSLTAILPKDHSKARMSVDGSPGEEVVGPVSAYQEWIMERAGSGNRVWIDPCTCERCGGLIAMECVYHMVTERCLSCDHEISYEVNVAMPSLVPLDPLRFRIRDPHPKAKAIALIREVVSPSLEISLSTVGERMKSDQGVLLNMEDTPASRSILDRLADLGCHLERL